MKRFFASLLCLALLFSALPQTGLTVHAEEPPEVKTREINEEEMNRMLEEDAEHLNDRVEVTDTVENIYFPKRFVSRASGLEYFGKADYHGYKVGIFTVNGETAFCMQHNNPQK